MTENVTYLPTYNPRPLLAVKERESGKVKAYVDRTVISSLIISGVISSLPFIRRRNFTTAGGFTRRVWLSKVVNSRKAVARATVPA